MKLPARRGLRPSRREAPQRRLEEAPQAPRALGRAATVSGVGCYVASQPRSPTLDVELPRAGGHFYTEVKEVSRCHERGRRIRRSFDSGWWSWPEPNGVWPRSLTTSSGVKSIPVHITFGAAAYQGSLDYYFCVSLPYAAPPRRATGIFDHSDESGPHLNLIRVRVHRCGIVHSQCELVTQSQCELVPETRTRSRRASEHRNENPGSRSTHRSLPSYVIPNTASSLSSSLIASSAAGYGTRFSMTRVGMSFRSRAGGISPECLEPQAPRRVQ